VTRCSRLSGLSTGSAATFLAWSGANWKKDRLDEEPSIRELIVPNNGIAMGTFRARSAEAMEYFVGWGGPIQRFAILVVDGEPCARDLHDVVRADGHAVVGGSAKFYATLRAIEPLTQAIKAIHRGKRWSLALKGLLDCGSGRCRPGERFGCSRIFGCAFGRRVAQAEDEADKQDASRAR
jgi:hypothetical protein